MNIDWTRVGPERPERIELPPVPMLLNGYVMDFDESLGEIVFLTGAGYDGFGEAWSYDGERWKQLHDQKLNLAGEGEHQGYCDPIRKGMVAFRFGWDSDSDTHRPQGMLVTASGTATLEMSGEIPIGPDGFGDVRGAFGYDRKRDVGVCVTPGGVWELDSKGTWTKVATLGPDDIAPEWKDACGSVWDPVREALVFWIFEDEDYTHVFHEWDGQTLTKLPTTGLPMADEGLREFCIGLFDPSASFAGHPEHGLVLLDGAHFWRFDGERWSELPATDNPPPRMKRGLLAYDPTRDALLLGPGFHDGDGGGRDIQQVFFEHNGGAWQTLGAKMLDSPVTALYGKHLYFDCRGTAYVVRLRSLRTFGWMDEEWREVVGEKAGEEVVGDAGVGAVIGMGDYALAVLTDGVICRFDGSSWTRTDETIPDFKERTDFGIARVGDTERLVVWGGEVKNRKSNDTFFRDDEGGWRKHEKASPRPKDFGSKHYVDFDLFWDSTLERVVRLGWEECFTLEGEVWKAWEPKDYQSCAGASRYEHLPVHDPKTGETLLVNLVTRTAIRFDLDGCARVATLELPDDEIGPERQHDRATWSKLNDDLWYEPESRTLRAQFAEDLWAQYAWDLSSAFEAAAELGERRTLDAAPEPTAKASKKSPAESGDEKRSKKGAAAAVAGETSAKLYVIDERSRKNWFCEAEGAHLVRRWGRIGAKQSNKREKKKSPAAAQRAAAKAIAKKRADGYRSASELELEAIACLGAIYSQPLRVGEAKKKAPPESSARLGGLPSGVPKKKWPTLDGEPMGFLLQLDTGDLLGKHAGVAVFCVTDGTATEDEDHNAAVLLTAAQWKKKPTKAPEGVPVLTVRPLIREAPKLEVLEDRVQELATEDPDLGDRFDELQGSPLVHDSIPWSKVGGEPAWVQDGELGDDWMLIAQLDFDPLSLEGEWKDAGLFGCLYVVARRDEKAAVAFWQYT